MKHWWTFRPNFRPEKNCCLPSSDPTKMPTRSRHPRPAVDVYEPWQLAGSMTELAWGVQGVRVSVTGWAPRVALGFSAKKKTSVLPDDPMANFFRCFLKKDLSIFGDSHASNCGSITSGNVFLDSWPDLWKRIRNWLLFSTVPIQACHSLQTNAKDEFAQHHESYPYSTWVCPK